MYELKINGSTKMETSVYQEVLKEFVKVYNDNHINHIAMYKDGKKVKEKSYIENSETGYVVAIGIGDKEDTCIRSKVFKRLREAEKYGENIAITKETDLVVVLRFEPTEEYKKEFLKGYHYEDEEIYDLEHFDELQDIVTEIYWR